MLDAWLSSLLGLPLFDYAVLAVAGVVAGTLNVLAGGGSFLTLPLLIFLGLPAGMANGTNRVGILLQNISAVRSFDEEQVLDRRSLAWAAVPATLGAGLGTTLALWISDDGFQRILAFLMVVISLLSFWSPKKKEVDEEEDPSAAPEAEMGPEMETEAEIGAETGADFVGPSRPAILAMGFFVVGIYGGFVQAGVGFLILAATSLGGLDLVRGNAVKVLTVLCFTALSLTIFAIQGKVQWDLGLALGAGTLLGGHFGARLTVLRGHRWVRRVVTAAILVFAVKLWLG